MACQCEIYEICAECATSPLQYENAVRAHDEAVQQIKPSTPSYTLTEIVDFVNEFSAGIGDDNVLIFRQEHSDEQIPTRSR